MTLLGPGQVARVSVETLRASGASSRVHEVSPQLAMLQVTADPMDDLIGELEKRLPAVRDVLAPLLVNSNDVTLE